jgi:DNA polymerase-1
MVPVLARMEMAGIKVDRETLSRMSGAFAQTMARLEAEVQEMAGRPFNLGSPKQLGELLFDELKLPGASRARPAPTARTSTCWRTSPPSIRCRGGSWTGGRSTSSRAPIPTTSRPRSTPTRAGAHELFHRRGQHRAARLLRSQPPEHPVRTEEGRRIRQAFVARRGVASSRSTTPDRAQAPRPHGGPAELKSAFREGRDIHAITASEMFGCPWRR